MDGIVVRWGYGCVYFVVFYGNGVYCVWGEWGFFVDDFFSWCVVFNFDLIWWGMYEIKFGWGIERWNGDNIVDFFFVLVVVILIFIVGIGGGLNSIVSFEYDSLLSFRLVYVEDMKGFFGWKVSLGYSLMNSGYKVFGVLW